jgi:hypothetical protein
MPIHKNGTIRCDRKDCRVVVKDWYIAVDGHPAYFCPNHLVQFMRLGNIKVQLTYNKPPLPSTGTTIHETIPKQASDGCDGVDSCCNLHPDKAAVLSEIK